MKLITQDFVHESITSIVKHVVTKNLVNWVINIVMIFSFLPCLFENVAFMTDITLLFTSLHNT